MSRKYSTNFDNSIIDRIKNEDFIFNGNDADHSNEEKTNEVYDQLCVKLNSNSKYIIFCLYFTLFV